MLETFHDIFVAMLRIWSTSGVSEFLSVLLGGGVTLLAQFLALRHDREKEAIRHTNEQKAQAWAIYFKISEAHEALTATAAELCQHRQMAVSRNVDLWQVLQFPPHEWNNLTWEISELVFLVDKGSFGLMQRYQEVMWWLSNLIQSIRLYRIMRTEFLTKTPSDVIGDIGSLTMTEENRNQIMPTIAHLKSLSESLEAVVMKQAPDSRALLKDYIIEMQKMVGSSPKQVEFTDEN